MTHGLVLMICEYPDHLYAVEYMLISPIAKSQIIRREEEWRNYFRQPIWSSDSAKLYLRIHLGKRIVVMCLLQERKKRTRKLISVVQW
jgi:hypothetical protein